MRSMQLGDPDYPSYPDTGKLTEDQHYFNQRLSRARCLAKCLDVGIALVLTVIVTCCTLHNICEKHNEPGPPGATGGDGVGAVDSPGGTDPSF